MFTRAGYSRRFRTVCCASVLYRGWSGTAYLLCFQPSGELVWLYAEALHWDAPRWFSDLIPGVPEYDGLECSPWPGKTKGPGGARS